MSPTEPTDYLALAMRTARSQFITACPFPFLFGEASLERPDGPQHTHIGDRHDPTRQISIIEEKAEGEPLLLPVRKVQTTFPSMITVGRTSNNDVIIPDINISKFHAYFRLVPNRPDLLEITDAGSRNGTYVAGRRLIAKGAPMPIQLGGALRFGQLQFTLLGPAAAWDQLHNTTDW